MKITRRFTKAGQDPFASTAYEKRTSRISNPDGTVVFEMKDAEIPVSWSQLATDIMVSKYFRKAGVPQTGPDGKPLCDENGNVVTGPEKSVRQVVNRLVGCWRWWGETHGYFDTPEDAQAFYDELAYMLIHQMCAPNSPQWFNTGLNWAYGISGPSQGHFYCDPKTGELKKADDAYTHPQPHACFIQSVADDLVNSGGIMDLWVREARLFKYGSGTGSNFSKVRAENESLSGGGRSSGLMSFLKIGDRAAGAIKSGGTTRRAAKMVCLDLDHPDIVPFVNWKVREELKVAAMVEGMKTMPRDQKLQCEKLGLKLDYDFNGEAYHTVSGQNSNNSVRIPNQFFHLVEQDGQWETRNRSNGKVAQTIKARDLWEQIAFAAWRCADPGVQYDDTINQWHTCPKSGRINASNPCVTGDTRVLTPNGVWRRIDQMIHLPARIFTNVDRQEIHVTDGAFPTGEKEVFELRTEGGYTLKVTGNHKIWTRLRGWVEASKLTSADEIRLPSQLAAFRDAGEPADPQFFQLLGIFCSESNDDATMLNLDRCFGDGPLLENYAEYVQEQWSDRHYDDDYVNYSLLGEDDGGGTATATLTNQRLMKRLRSYARNAGIYRGLADGAFTAGLAAQKHLLRGLFSADGMVIDGSLQIAVSSLSLLQDVQLILLGFGIRAVIRPSASRHTLRIHEDSLRAFAVNVGLLPGSLCQELQTAAQSAKTLSGENGHWERIAGLAPLGKKQVFDLTETVTHSFVANGITVHNCSEYMFLDDTACNLASLNVLKFFDVESLTFDTEGFKHGVQLWTVVLEISVLMASFPSEEIAQLSYQFRTLGLGYANLGAMLMQVGIPYNCDKGRAICAALTAILTGESYAISAQMAGEHGAFAGYEKNSQEMLRVIRNHRRAAYDVTTDAAAKKQLGDYEGLDIKPVGIDVTQFSDADPLASSDLLATAQDCWDRALSMGEEFGYRNAQVSVIAPTGTIGLLMDCDTTGVEPDFALVKFKKLAGGGYFKIANQSLRPAFTSLGYSPQEIQGILEYVTGTMSLENTPHINRASLMAAGLNEQDLQKIQQVLPSVFELSFAFTPWTLGPETMKRLNILESESGAPGFNMLRRLGFSGSQINQANDVVCGRGTVEGAPQMKIEHYQVFECAARCGKTGKQLIPPDGHIRMMAAAQPFISGAISKTINLPNEATIEDIKSAYHLSWQLGLKANALYRDGSKLSQPLNVKSDEELDKSEDDDLNNVDAAKEELASDVAKAVKTVHALTSRGEVAQKEIHSDNLTLAHTNVVEKIVERIVERPLRRRLPDTRSAITHKFDVAGHEGYLTVGLYEDGTPGEVFITMAKEGSTIGGLMDCVATLVSVSLQYGVPVDSLVRKFEHVRFEPSGMTRNQEIPFAKSLVDYIFRWLAMEFIPGYRSQHAPKREKKSSPGQNQDDKEPAKGGNGYGTAMRADTAHGFAYTEGEMKQATSAPAAYGRLVPNDAPDLRLTLVSADPLSQMSSLLQADAPACDVCGSITVRSGTCYKCLNCGNSMGCS